MSHFGLCDNCGETTMVYEAETATGDACFLCKKCKEDN